LLLRPLLLLLLLLVMLLITGVLILLLPAVTNRHVLKDFLLPQEAVMESAKCQELGRLLPELKAKGSRVLLFSQWTQVGGACVPSKLCQGSHTSR
jgi:SNF2 family DNA or RNA helicase